MANHDKKEIMDYILQLFSDESYRPKLNDTLQHLISTRRDISQSTLMRYFDKLKITRNKDNTYSLSPQEARKLNLKRFQEIVADATDENSEIAACKTYILKTKPYENHRLAQIIEQTFRDEVYYAECIQNDLIAVHCGEQENGEADSDFVQTICAAFGHTRIKL